MLISNLHNIIHILPETQLLQRFSNMLASNRLLAFFLANLVCLRRDERDELDAAFNEQVAGVFAECQAFGGWQDFVDDFLDRGWRRG